MPATVFPSPWRSRQGPALPPLPPSQIAPRPWMVMLDFTADTASAWTPGPTMTTSPCAAASTAAWMVANSWGTFRSSAAATDAAPRTARHEIRIFIGFLLAPLQGPLPLRLQRRGTDAGEGVPQRAVGKRCNGLYRNGLRRT